MNCARFEESIARYIGGDLTPEEAWPVEQHLRACAACAELAAELEADRAWLRSRPPEPADVDFEAMRRAIRREIARPRWNWKWIPALAGAAATVLAVALSLPYRVSAPALPMPIPPAVAMQPVIVPIAAPRKPARPKSPPAEPPLTLEAAIRMFEALEPPPPPPGSDSPIEMHLTTSDPNVTIIILEPSHGDSR